MKKVEFKNNKKGKFFINFNDGKKNEKYEWDLSVYLNSDGGRVLVSDPKIFGGKKDIFKLKTQVKDQCAKQKKTKLDELYCKILFDKDQVIEIDKINPDYEIKIKSGVYYPMLHIAILKWKYKMVESLLKAGADINKKDKLMKTTALIKFIHSVFAYYKNIKKPKKTDIEKIKKIYKILIKYKANLTDKDQNGKIAKNMIDIINKTYKLKL